MGWSNSGWESDQGGWYKNAAAAGTPTLTYISAATPSVASTVATATAANIGAASADRLVVVVYGDGFSNPGAVTMTIGGVSATAVAVDSNNGGSTAIFSLLVTSGTTANIVATCGGIWSLPVFEVYTITGLSSTTAVGANHGTAAGTSVSTTLATSSGGVMIAVGSQQGGGGASVAITGTETFTSDATPTGGGNYLAEAAHATGIATNASSSVTATWGASTSSSLSAASWR